MLSFHELHVALVTTYINMIHLFGTNQLPLLGLIMSQAWNCSLALKQIIFVEMQDLLSLTVTIHT